jgi:low affinity Fe/Cu permease
VSGRFDRFADWTADIVASAYFFAGCCLLVVVWIPTIFIPHMSIDTWQLIINTLTTIVTFLMVALLQNDAHRFERATNARLEEILDKLAGAADPVSDPGQKTRG